MAYNVNSFKKNPKKHAKTKTSLRKCSFLDALASLDLKLSVSQSLMFFRLPVIPVFPVIVADFYASRDAGL